jgi:hypothetical protein
MFMPVDPAFAVSSGPGSMDRCSMTLMMVVPQLRNKPGRKAVACRTGCRRGASGLRPAGNGLYIG